MPRIVGKSPKGLIPMRTLEAAADVVRVLGHPHRMRIIELILSGDHSVGQLAEALGLPPAAVSQHLGRMKAHGLVSAERLDRQVYYRVVNPIARHMVDCLRRYGDGRGSG